MPSTITITNALGMLLQSDHASARAFGAVTTTAIGVGIGTAAYASVQLLNAAFQAAGAETNNEANYSWLPTVLAASSLISAIIAVKLKKTTAYIGSFFNPPSTSSEEKPEMTRKNFAMGQPTDTSHPYLLST